MQTLTRPQPARLSAEQKARFEEDGYLVVKGVLSPEACAHYLERIDGLDRRHRDAKGLGGEEFVEIRNAVEKEPEFLGLLDYPTSFPLVAELMGANIQLCTSHTMVRPPQPKDTDAKYKRIGWHRDGCAEVQPVHGTYPWIYTKIGYFLTDLSKPGMGNLRVIPGSHKKADCPKTPAGAIDPEGAVEVCVEAGDAVIFQQRLWHAVGPNVSDVTRKNIYVGYCFRWVKPLDYLTPSPELLARATPVQRQLLGEHVSEMTFWLPKETELPLRGWLRDHTNSKTAVACACV
ncbi:MAG: phytanoyl-CoA dioxygenase family protein [Planctomycetota bacterium]|nr:phytanoyl-CoA dioxygenase family protein [Planctomycetota bacterium]